MRREVETFCARIGADRLLVQGAGGNVSWKEGGELLWVKASGTWLADACLKDIFVQVVLETAQAKPFPLNMVSTNGLRPSIETLLHVLLPQKIVVHLHAVDILANLVRENGALERVKLLQGFSWPYIDVDYAMPGTELAALVAQSLAAQPDAQVVMLENHGVVVAAASLAEIEAILLDLLTRFRPPSLYSPSHSLELAAQFRAGAGIQLESMLDVAGEDFHCLATDEHLLKRLRQDWALYPDHLVFLGRQPSIYDSVADALSDCHNEQVTPGIPLFIAGVGVFTIARPSSARLAQMRCYQDVLLRQQEHTRLKSLKADDIEQLLAWEAEKYRQQLGTRFQ